MPRWSLFLRQLDGVEQTFQIVQRRAFGGRGQRTTFGVAQPSVNDFKPAPVSLLDAHNLGGPSQTAFLNLPGIAGDSADDQHPNQINVLSFNWGGDAIKAIKEGLKDKEDKTLMKAAEGLSDDEIKALVKYARDFKK